MVLFWRGWGLAVFWTFLFWMIAGIVLAVMAGPYQPDPVKAGLEVQWGFAGMFAVHAASVFLLALYRRSHPLKVVDPATQKTVLVPHVDDFMFIRFDLWPYILLAIAAVFAVSSLLGYQLFSD